MREDSAGRMSADPCVESHLRELLEQGFEVAMPRTPPLSPSTPDLGDGYAAALTDFACIANAVLATDEATEA